MSNISETIQEPIEQAGKSKINIYEDHPAR